MKRLILFLSVLSLSVTPVYAETTLNLLNPNAFALNGNTLANAAAIPVLPSETYTLSFPDYQMLDWMHVEVRGETTTYIDETLGDNTVCSHVGYYTICTFTTDGSETGLYLTFSEGFIGQFYNYHEMFDFQLEKGDTKTAYVPYASAPDQTTPLVQGAGLVELNYARNTSLSTLIAETITVTDNMDGDITDQIVILDDTYTGHETIPGEYQVLLSATDSSGNETQFELIIVVVDLVPPVINGPAEINVQVDQRPALSDLIAKHVTFIDALDGPLETYEIIQDTYSEATTVGTYDVTLRAFDRAGNITERTFNVIVESTLPSVIEGPSQVRLYLSALPNDTDITALYEALDRATLESLAIQIKASNITDYKVAGRYTVELEAVDPYNNAATKTIRVIIEDDIPPIFTYDDQIVVPLGSSLSDLDLFHMVKSHYLERGIIVDSVRIIDNAYADHPFETGEYAYTAEIVSNTGESFVHTGRIAVIEASEEPRIAMTPLMWTSLAVCLGSVSLLLVKKQS